MSNIKSITKKPLKEGESLWNLAVEQNESYVANDIVVHNCRSLLIPITKFEDWEATNTKSIERLIEKSTGPDGNGFARQSTKRKPIQITDPLVSFETKSISEAEEETVYSHEGKPFQKSTIVYKDKSKKEIVSVNHARLDDDKKV